MQEWKPLVAGLDRMKAKLAEAKSLLAPEPEAGDPYQGLFQGTAVIATDTSKGGFAGGEAAPIDLMPTLGTGPELPR